LSSPGIAENTDSRTSTDEVPDHTLDIFQSVIVLPSAFSGEERGEMRRK
jgi:hypothetical protein